LADRDVIDPEQTLTVTRMPGVALAHIALTLQFSCQANFTRAFREATGQTPAQYRRSVGMIAAEPAAKNDNS
jgi:AraC-like DNA-binding protein